MRFQFVRLTIYSDYRCCYMKADLRSSIGDYCRSKGIYSKQFPLQRNWTDQIGAFVADVIYITTDEFTPGGVGKDKGRSQSAVRQIC